MFTTPDPDKLPLPLPDLLALHATCAQVAHLSGAGEYVDRILEAMEQMDELAPDGTSSDVLQHALMTASRAITVDGTLEAMEQIDVLALDGTSSDVLHYALTDMTLGS